MNYFRSIYHKQKGIILLEAIIAIGITGILGIGITSVISQVFNQTIHDSTHLTAINQVENAVHCISRDAQMAISAQIDEGASGFPVTFSWVEWDGSTCQVTYSIEENDMQRSLSINGGEPVANTVAQYIDTDVSMTNCQFAEGALSLKITSTVGKGSLVTSETAKRQIIPRPILE